MGTGNGRGKRFLLPVLLGVLLVPVFVAGFFPHLFSGWGWAGGSETGGEPEVATDPGFTFAGESMRLTAYFEGDAVRLVISDGTEVVLPRAISASGARFSDGITEFWNKGDEARFQWEGNTYQLRAVDPRADPWERAKGRGVDFRAIGQEPGWLLEVWDGRRIRLILDYGETEIVTPVSLPMDEGVEGVTVYRTRAAASPLDVTVTLRREACYDVMSGEGFTFAVTVELGDGRVVYKGCGRPL